MERIDDAPEVVRIARAVALVAGVRGGSLPARTERVATLAAALAGLLGLRSDEAAGCEAAGWLRDIGLVALPDAALSPLSVTASDDSPVVRMHAEIGEQAVRRVPELACLASAVRHHHERFDGSGYPDRLAGEQIPLAARIVACAEQVAALIPSPVIDPRVRRAATARLRGLEGSALDPAVVAAAVATLAAEAERAGQYLPRAA